jgi:hypothetical protein
VRRTRWIILLLFNLSLVPAILLIAWLNASSEGEPSCCADWVGPIVVLWMLVDVIFVLWFVTRALWRFATRSSRAASS